MTNRPYHLKTDKLADAVARSVQCGSEGRWSNKSAVDVTRDAVRSANGQNTIEARLDMHDSRPTQTAPGVPLSQVVDSVAIEVKALIDRMRCIAEEGARNHCSFEQFIVLQQEFEILQGEYDLLLNEAAGSLHAMHGEEASMSFRELELEVLKIDRAHASVSSTCESEWALVRLDFAEDAVNRLMDEFGTIDDRLDDALLALDALVQSMMSDTQDMPTVHDLMDAAQHNRLLRMQGAALEPTAGSNEFQQSVFALLQ